jgi:hypothetical protein
VRWGGVGRGGGRKGEEGEVVCITTFRSAVPPLRPSILFLPLLTHPESFASLKPILGKFSEFGHLNNFT